MANNSEKIKIDKNKFKHFILAIIIVIAGLGLMLALMMLRKPPQQGDTEILAPLVDVKKLDPCDMQMTISGFGTVEAEHKVDIVPQVEGRVVDIHPQLQAGGFIPANETIIQIDPKDYRLAVQQAKASVAQARVQLEIEQAEAAVARDEWYDLNPGTEPDSPLVLRKPQIKQAQANLQSAKAKLATAKLNLERTKVTMPVDLYISAESIDLGQLARAGNPIASAFGTKKAEVFVPLEDKNLAWFDIPPQSVSFNGNKKSKGSKAVISTKFAGKKHHWQGRVTRTTAQVDKKSRLVTVVIEIQDPFNTKGNPPLLPGTFVEVDIYGHRVKGFYKIPRMAVKNADQVWVAENGNLKISSVDIRHSDQDYIYTDKGFEKDRLIVTTPLDAVTDGMKIRYEGYNDINDVNNDPDLSEVQQ